VGEFGFRGKLEGLGDGIINLRDFVLDEGS
jgi:hypothetical protein